MMNDRFKFRVWNEQYGRYIQDNEYPIGGDYSLSMTQYGYVEVIGFGDYQEGSDTTYSWGRVKNIREYIGECIVEQCTGLKDKNGKLIYEGDVVKINGWWYACGPSGYRENKCVVEYDEEVAGFTPMCNYDCDCGVYHYAEDCEVIGNIHTDKNLLDFS